MCVSKIIDAKSDWRTLFFVWNAANENTTDQYIQAYSWFVCNHLATTKRKECNLKTELQKIIAKTKKKWKQNLFYIFVHKTNKVQLKSFEMYVSIWALQTVAVVLLIHEKRCIFLFVYFFWFVVNYRSWIMSEIVRISINQNADFTHVSANYRSNAIWAVIAIFFFWLITLHWSNHNNNNKE